MDYHKKTGEGLPGKPGVIIKLYENVCKELLSSAGITVNGNKDWDIQVHNDDFYRRALIDGNLGLGESYMDGWWDCKRLDEFIYRVLKANLESKVKTNVKTLARVLLAKIYNFQSKSRAFQIGERHYDIGNDLYGAMLDKRMVYTCAYWRNAKNLDEAQEAKMDKFCKMAGLKPGMKVLDMGCGFGCLAKYAAEKYGVEVVGITVSKEQAKLGRELCTGLPVEIRLQDYRDLNEKFDAVIAIGIMEHVGYKNYRHLMEVADRCLDDNGIFALHVLGNNVSRITYDPWFSKYIFPNTMIPSLKQVAASIEGLFVVEDLHNVGPDYDKTLMVWYENFQKAWPNLRNKYGDRFKRMWDYYLLCCAGSFRARDVQVWHIAMTKQGREQPDCRIS